MPNWDKDPVRHGRVMAIEGRAYTRPCKAKNKDVLLCIPYHPERRNYSQTLGKPKYS